MNEIVLLQPCDEILKNDATGLILTTDHARNVLPSEYGTLGLSPDEFNRHIAYDIGAEDLTRALAERLDSSAVICGFSRLLIDPNRGEDDPTLIMQLSDGAVVSGNYPLSERERCKRIENFYRPYDNAVKNAIARVENAAQKAPFVIAIHSYTPIWRGVIRPWHAAVLWNNDPRIAKPLILALRQNETLVIGDNEPYDGALRNDMMYRHCTQNGLAHVLLEVRQDLIADSKGVTEWADRLAPIFRSLNDQPENHQRQYFGSRV